MAAEGERKFTTETVLFGHVDEATAYVVDDYPYGYTLRTQIRYWIETTKHGDRFVSQTLNPKVAHEHWNKPKKSTYIEVGAMFLTSEGHVTWTGLGHWAEDEAIKHFLEVTEGHLSDAQKKKVAEIIGMKKGFEGVTWKCTENPSKEERERLDAEQAVADRVIGHRVAVATQDAMQDLGVA